MNVEMMGVSIVKIALSKTDYIVPHINDNDKQSFRAEIIECPNYYSKRSKK